jgi:metallo-beta-lactamase class B
MNPNPATRFAIVTSLAAVLLVSNLSHAAADNWSKPFPGHRVIGNLYAVGSYDLSVFLITSDDGHILINTGLEDSTAMIRENIESLGFQLEDVKILLCMQAHWDHAAALAEIKSITGAELLATPHDNRILADGGFTDPHFGGKETFKPVEVDRVIRAGDLVELGDIELTVYEHGGHTEGSSSYSMQIEENDRLYDVVIANMGTINDGKNLVVDPTYPGVAEDFSGTFEQQKTMSVDVWVAAHGSQYRLHEKYQPGDPYSPDTFVDPDGFTAEVERLELLYLQQVAEEYGESVAP